MDRIEEIAKAKPAAVLLREKDLTEAEYRALAERVLAICGAEQVPCILHSYVNAAMELNAEALHAPLPILRQMTAGEKGAFRTLGASCHSVEEAMEAERLGCTYLTAGHIFETGCKKGVPGRGIEFLKEVCAAVAIPVWAIGGIHSGNIASVRAAGANAACVMSGPMGCGHVGNYFGKFEKRRKPVNFNEKMLTLYAVTDRAWTGEKTLYQQIEAALEGGVTCVQLREKHLELEAFVEEAISVRQLCRRYGVPLIINDNVDVALKSGADGVHVGMEDAPVAEIRSRVGRDFLIGATAKTVAQATAAEAAGADYLGVGAVFPSPTKKNAIRITEGQLAEICASVHIPAVAIGGITQDNVDQIRGCGMKGVAVVSAIFAAGDITAAARALKQKVETLL